MSKELEYEFNNFANLLHKDCMNLMECLKKQSEDNKPILYLGKHYQKVILPYEEYKKMCNRLEEQEKKTYSDELKLVEKKLQRLESIDNAEPSKAINSLEFICKILNEKRIDVKWLFKGDYNIIVQALLRLESIDNANPSEALAYIDAFIEENNNDTKNQDITGFDIDTQAKWVKYLGHKTSMLSIIKQALLKAQEQKQYLKWEDLKFTDERQTIKVLLNGEKYFVKYKKEYLFGYYEKVEITNGTFILCTLGSVMKQFFNDLHLERVEE